MRVRAAVLIAAALLLSAGAFRASRCREVDRPAIVLVVWDTCRADRVSVNGYSRPTTPRLSALAAEGVNFRHCYTPSPWTPPAHASLFTGLLPRRHGLGERQGDTVHHGIPLLAETLRDAGYQTVAMVNNPYVSSVTGLDAGFETYFANFDRDYHKGKGEEALRQVESWLLRRRARGSDGRPLFLFINLMDPHLPYTCDAESAAAMGLDGLDAGAREAAFRVEHRAAMRQLAGVERLEPPALQALGAVYDAAVRTTDRVTGSILDLLEAEGLLEGAFVAVAGDHGENLGEGGRLDHVMSVHETTLHVPLVVRWPGRLDGGRVEDTQVRLQDLYPTILEAAGVPAPAPCGTDARSLLESPLRPRVAVAEFGPFRLHSETGQDLFGDLRPEIYLRSFLAVRDPSGRKYVETTLHPEGGPPFVQRECLFDLPTDPGETRCLLDEDPPPGVRAEAEGLRDLGR